MSTQVKHLGILATALGVIALSLAACTANPISSSGGNAPSGLTFTTPDTSQFTATPGFPTFTVGAWVSNFSPNVNDTITIYVLCRVQDPTMQTASQPPSQAVQIKVVLQGPIGATLAGATDTDGIAAIPYTLNDPFVGQPVNVFVTATYKGQAFYAQTFFTAAPYTPPTATTQPTVASNTPTPSPTAKP
ncbi:MAG TPA: hypothetical protein VGN32_02170 [Ktedonobacterales bacterium]|jgi:hypothetical protein|nr:hypothetical protein [Ktedonobacterales bacterium]